MARTMKHGYRKEMQNKKSGILVKNALQKDHLEPYTYIRGTISKMNSDC